MSFLIPDRVELTDGKNRLWTKFKRDAFESIQSSEAKVGSIIKILHVHRTYYNAIKIYKISVLNSKAKLSIEKVSKLEEDLFCICDVCSKEFLYNKSQEHSKVC